MSPLPDDHGSGPRGCHEQHPNPNSIHQQSLLAGLRAPLLQPPGQAGDWFMKQQALSPRHPSLSGTCTDDEVHTAFRTSTSTR